MSHYSTYSDDRLVSLLQTGDKLAFEAVYHRYAAGLYGYARKNIPVKQDCEEIVQDIFESLWVRHENLAIQSLQHYLFRMVRYKVIRYFQHKNVKKKYAEHFRLFEAVYDNTAPEERDTAALQTMIEKAIDRLPERCRVAIRLRLIQNLSNGEIAKIMNITKKTVEVYMFTAFNHLRANCQNP